MKLFKEIVFAASLTLGAAMALADAHAHEIKFGDLVIEHPWARQSSMGAQVAAGYMTIVNNGKQDDRLLSASAGISAIAQLHDMKMDGDVMKMAEMAGGIVIPAGGSAVLKPMSLHIMFMGLKAPVREGESFEATLTFEKAGSITVDFEVMAPTAGMNMN